MNILLENSAQFLTRPVSLAELGTADSQLQGAVPLAAMERLRAQLQDDEGEAAVEIEFSCDAASGLRTVRGRLTTRVQLLCQRCLEPMPWAIDTRFKLALIDDIANEQAVPADYEAIVVENGEINLLQLLEDELLLCLPISPRHDADTSCRTLGGASLEQEMNEAETGRTSSPFAVLQQLKSVQPSEKH